MQYATKHELGIMEQAELNIVLVYFLFRASGLLHMLAQVVWARIAPQIAGEGGRSIGMSGLVLVMTIAVNGHLRTVSG